MEQERRVILKSITKPLPLRVKQSLDHGIKSEAKKKLAFEKATKGAPWQDRQANPRFYDEDGIVAVVSKHTLYPSP